MKEAMLIMGGLFIQMVVLASLMVKRLLDGVISRSPRGRIYVMFGPVITTEACIVQARTRVQLALACQQSLIHAQRRLRLTMQHVYGHSGNLGNECAVHAAALGTFGLISNHNVATRWTRHNFDASVCFDGCNNIRTNATSFHQDREMRWFFSSGPPCPCALHVSKSLVFLLLSGFFSLGCCFPNK